MVLPRLDRFACHSSRSMYVQPPWLALLQGRHDRSVQEISPRCRRSGHGDQQDVREVRWKEECLGRRLGTGWRWSRVFLQESSATRSRVRCFWGVALLLHSRQTAGVLQACLMLAFSARSYAARTSPPPILPPIQPLLVRTGAWA